MARPTVFLLSIATLLSTEVDAVDPPAGKAVQGPYNITAVVEAADRLTAPDRATLVCQWRDADNYTAIDFRAAKICVRTVRDGAVQATTCRDIQFAPGTAHDVLIKRRVVGTTIFVDGRPILEEPLAGQQGRFGVTAESKNLPITDVALQRVGPIVVADDFSRTSEHLGIWERRTGDWSVAELRHASFSSNAFCFEGRGDRAFAAAGYWFWEDYRFSAAVRRHSGTAAVGLAAYALNADNGLLFRWQAETFQLVAVVDGSEYVIAEQAGHLRSSQWYELSIWIHGESIACYVDRYPLIEVDLAHVEQRPARTGGRLRYAEGGGVGLLTGGGAAHFDDVLVESVDRVAPRRLSPRTPVVKERFANDKKMKAWSQRVLKNDRVLDYTFHAAPTDWLVQSGDWGIQTRWACQPRWSWFGGNSEQTAAVWHKYEFDGSVVVEIYAGFAMDSPFAPFYNRVGDINITVAGNGIDLNSGYTMVFAGWDNRFTRLLREDRIVAESPEILLPENRDAFQLESLHWQWHQVRLVKRRDMIRGYVNGRLAVAFDDPEPLTGNRLAVWTWDNQLLLARAAVAGSKITATAPAARRPVNMGGGDHACTGPNTRPTSHRLPANDVRATPFLRFHYDGSPGMRLNFYLKTRGRQHAVAFTATTPQRADIPVIARCENPAVDLTEGSVGIDLSGLTALYGDGKPLQLDEITVGLLSDDAYAVAGFNGNRAGMACRLSGFAFEPARRAGDVACLAAHAAGQPEEKSTAALFSNTFSRDTGQWHNGGGVNGATLHRDILHAASGNASLKLTNARMGGNFAAVARDEPYSPRRYPIVRFDYRAPHDLRVDLVVGLDDGRKVTVKFTDFDHTWPVIGEFPDVQQDLKWHQSQMNLLKALSAHGAGDQSVTSLTFASGGFPGVSEGLAWWIDNFTVLAPVQPPESDRSGPGGKVLSPAPDTAACPDELRLTLVDDGALDAGSIRLRIDDRTWHVGNPALSYDAETGTLRWQALKARPFRSIWQDNKPVHCRLTAADEAGNAMKPLTWSWTATFDKDRKVPPPPYVSYVPSKRLVYQMFEENIDGFGNWVNCDVTRTERTAATGDACAALMNLSSTNRFLIGLANFTVPTETYPYLRCDLSLSGMSQIDRVQFKLSKLFFNGTTDTSPTLLKANRRGGTGFAVYDCDLRRRATAGSGAPYGILLEAVLQGRLAEDKIGGVTMYLDNFTIYSRQDSTPSFEWQEPPDVSGIEGYSWVFDQVENTVPPERVRTRQNQAHLQAVTPGKWWFHVRAVDHAGNWSKAGRTWIVVE
jgi:hypothetical protein